MDNHALWVSRHPMDAKAEEEVKTRFNVNGVDSVDFAFSEDSEKALNELQELVNNYQIFGGVFPAQVWFSLLKNASNLKGKSMFLVVSKALPVENGIRTFQFDHLELLDL